MNGTCVRIKDMMFTETMIQNERNIGQCECGSS